MITVLIHRGDSTSRAPTVEPAWLAPDSGVTVWVDISQPDSGDRQLLTDVFHFHELSVEDALADVHHPKIESYDNYLYLILHGIAAGQNHEGFVTRDVDFFLGPNYLVTVRHQDSRSIEEQQEICNRHSGVWADGAAGLMHRIVDLIVDHYRPEVDALEDRLEGLERIVFESPRTNPLRDILLLKRDVASLRRVTLPQRDAIGRLARREFPEIPDQLAYRFRDVYDNLVRLTDDAVSFQDRVTGLLDAYLSSQSNRLNQVMKVLTVISTIFMPLTVLTSLWGMNVALPKLPGGEPAQFWWVMALMLGSSGGMLWMFRKAGWL
jgi:magnesium transporter